MTMKELEKQIEKQLQEVGEALKTYDRLLCEKAASLGDVEKRLGMAKEELPRLAAEREEVRAERQKALASGNGQASAENLALLAQRLKDIDQARELCEDKITGLSAFLEQLGAERAELKADRKAAARKIPMIKLRGFAQCYNAIAADLEPILVEMWKLRGELGEPPEGKVVLFPGGFLDSLPRAFLPGEEGFEEVSDPGKFFFFDAPGMKEKRSSRVRPLLVDEDPPAAEGGGTA